MIKPEYFFLYDVPDHNDIKDKLLLYFDDLTEKYNLEDNESYNISSTDYFISGRIKERPYGEIIKEYIYPIVENNFLRLFDCQGVKFQGYWFQQYEEGSSFSMHTHPASHFAAIYYVESPPGSETEFALFDPPAISEGQLLVFPSFLPHRSNPNPSKERKTVVSFNFDLHYKKYIESV